MRLRDLFDLAFLSKCASISFITAEFSILVIT